MAHGIAKADGVCKCGGEIRAGITHIRWAPSTPGSIAHNECYFYSTARGPILKRDKYGKTQVGDKPPDPEPLKYHYKYMEVIRSWVVADDEHGMCVCVDVQDAKIIAAALNDREARRLRVQTLRNSHRAMGT